jgi:hypothetical protein
MTIKVASVLPTAKGIRSPPARVITFMALPSATTDPRAGETALAVALGGAICPVPFVMSVAALRIAAPRTTRRTRIAWWLAAATIALQAAAIVTVLAVLLPRWTSAQ